jgi:cytochrome c biogenesis protein CcmG, thiol:disulfide interchange protein DsbE
MSRQRKIIIGVSTCCFLVFALIIANGALSGSSAAPRHGPPPLAHPFSLHALGSSGQVSLSQYAGRPVMINFFASWCYPCQQETPLIARFYRSHQGTVAIIGIDVNDSTSAALRFVRHAGVGYPVGSDPTAVTATEYGVAGIPQTFFLDSAHRVVKHVVGAVTLTSLDAGLVRMGYR